LTIHIFASLAQHERKMISERTRAALQAIKKREKDPVKLAARRKLGKKPMGNPNGAAPLLRAANGNKAGVAEIKARASHRATDVLPIILSQRCWRSPRN